MTDEFRAAVDRVLRELELGDNGHEHMEGVGVRRADCEELMRLMIEPGRPFDNIASIVQAGVATGVLMERARWYEGTRLIEGDI